MKQVQIMTTLQCICIPRVFTTISKNDIIYVFDSILGKGSVRRVDIVYSNSNKDKRAFIHFNVFQPSDISRVIGQRLSSGKDIKIVYADPWFWKCSASRA